MTTTRVIVTILASITYLIVIGGATYEHLSVVPRWSAAPPASLAMFQGPYGLAPETFWQVIHPVTLLLLLGALTFGWRTPARPYLLASLVGYVLVLLATALYFVPELLAIIGTPYSPTSDPGLVARAGQWERLSLIRLGVLLILAIVLLAGLIRSAGGRLHA